jgi:hypothetical protein
VPLDEVPPQTKADVLKVLAAYNVLGHMLGRGDTRVADAIPIVTAQLNKKALTFDTTHDAESVQVTLWEGTTRRVETVDGVEPGAPIEIPMTDEKQDIYSIVLLANRGGPVVALGYVKQ